MKYLATCVLSFLAILTFFIHAEQRVVLVEESSADN